MSITKSTYTNAPRLFRECSVMAFAQSFCALLISCFLVHGAQAQTWEVLDGSRTSVVAVDATGPHDVESDCDGGSAAAALLDNNLGTCCRWSINDVTDVSLTIDPTYLVTWEMGRVGGTWDFTTQLGPDDAWAYMYDARNDTQSESALTFTSTRFHSDPDFTDDVTWVGSEVRLNLSSTFTANWNVCDLPILYNSDFEAIPVCGNSAIEIGETCDDGNTMGGDGCSATCNVEICGNGVLDVGEECDDSNTTGGDGCSAICAIEEIVPGLDYDDAFCQQVVGTLNIHWEDVTTPETPCDGIEFTDGTLLDAIDGDVVMSGTSVSNPLCIGQGSYTFSVSPDGLTLTGTDTSAGVNMTLTRTPTQSCFSGHWILGPYDFVAHLGAEVFGAEVVQPVPSLSRFGIAMLSSLLGLAGWRRWRA
jgi:cysteine-rich repeat protein